MSHRSLRARTGRAALALLIGLSGAVAVAAPAQAATLTQVSSFGSNPGNLNMYSYRPDGLPSGAPAVVLLHGCTQNATTYFNNSGWRKYADQWKFSLIVAEQKSVNQSLSCFTWYELADISRGQGEALSIRNMVAHAVNNYGTNPAKVYISGLSAGGAMSSVMLATYPDVFAAGSVVAGLPYKCATSSSGTNACQYTGVNKTPAQWGDLVRNAYSGYGGPYPRVSIWHGSSDGTVVPMNATESMEQWTNVRGVSQTPTSTQSQIGNTSLKVYGNDDVRLYMISGMGHGTPVKPGSAGDQCGTAAAYFLNTICAAYHEARFFGLDGGTNPPTGPPAPTGLAVTGVTNTSVSLSWNAVSGATGYHVYRDGTKVTSSTLTATSYTDGGRAAGTTYQYRVTAINGTGEGTQSSAVSATTTGAAPVCATSSNYAHTTAGRAYHSGGYTYANGSNQNMGLWNLYTTTTLKQTGANYWVIGTC